MRLSKFHDRKSLVAGAMAGVLVMVVGAVLSIHCIDMVRYYKKHRIVKIDKASTHRIVTKK